MSNSDFATATVEMSFGFLFALIFGVQIGNVVVADSRALDGTCIADVSLNEMIIHGCQAPAYEIFWDSNTPLDFIFLAEVTQFMKFDIALGDQDCFFSVESAEDSSSGEYILSHGSYKAKPGEFKLHLTAYGKLQTSNTAVVCDNVRYFEQSRAFGLNYYAIAQREIKNFSVTIKGHGFFGARITNQILVITTSTTTTGQPTTSGSGAKLMQVIWADFDELEVPYFGFLDAYQVGVLMFFFSLAFLVSITCSLMMSPNGELYYAPDREYDHPPSDDDV
ncbi:hypothetical protein M3Y98_00697900 [Aphelenchoides besseyi]|nr:hypothetical protein M3Y98_00697900 [Aphelenchoides besseyi]